MQYIRQVPALSLEQLVEAEVEGTPLTSALGGPACDGVPSTHFLLVPLAVHLAAVAFCGHIKTLIIYIKTGHWVSLEVGAVDYSLGVGLVFSISIARELHF